MSMANEPLIEVAELSKKYCRSLKRSMSYGLKDIACDVFGVKGSAEALRKEEFWGLEDVSFSLRRGECLGLIGANGSGKSSLLKLLNGIILPDRGKITTRGQVAALIEVGAGFHPMLSGRENIYINGAILGMSRRYIDESFDSIVEFAELDDAIDMPVKHYSSGMYVRLGFAIASKLKADIVLLDEILSVGDVRFQAKCFNAINDLMQDSAVIFVSHSMAQISRISSKVACMNSGRMELFDDPALGIDRYMEHSGIQHEVVVTGIGSASILDFRVQDARGTNTTKANYLDAIKICLTADIDPAVVNPVVVISIYSSDMRIVAQYNSHFNKAELTTRRGRAEIELLIEQLFLNPGVYSIAVGIMDENNREVLVRVDNISSLTVQGDFYGYAPVQLNGQWFDGTEIESQAEKGR